MTEKGLFLVKPDGLLLGEGVDAFARIDRAGLFVIESKAVTLSPTQVNELYVDKQDHLSPYWQGYLTTRPSLVLVVEGDDVNRKLGEIKRGLRSDYQHDRFYTGTHCSDSPQAAKREEGIIFNR